MSIETIILDFLKKKHKCHDRIQEKRESAQRKLWRLSKYSLDIHLKPDQ